MSMPKQIAKHFREVYFGGNWTASNVKEMLSDVTWEDAVTKVYGLNTIAVLVNHIHYYVRAVGKVLDGKDLIAKDTLSFDHPPINNQEDWEQFTNPIWDEAEHFACLLEQLPDNRLEQLFIDQKYGTYYRNISGIIEHTHYHLGQIAMIKRIIHS